MSEQLLDPDTLIPFVPPPPPPPPAPITIDDLLNTVEILQKKEADDKALLETIGTMSLDELKTKLIAWAKAGFPNMYELSRVTITPPSTCSDGVRRELLDYIQFCSGKPIYEHVNVLNEKTSGMTIAYTKDQNSIVIVVSKV